MGEGDGVGAGGLHAGAAGGRRTGPSRAQAAQDYDRPEFAKPAVCREGPIAAAQLDDLADACRRRGIVFKASIWACVVASSSCSDAAATGATGDASNVLAGRFERLFACPRSFTDLSVYTPLDAPLS